MDDKALSAAALIAAAGTTVNDHTHIAYAVDTDDKTTLTKIGFALINARGDLTLSLDPKHTTANIILCRKDAG
jgi:hypothetical protein